MIKQKKALLIAGGIMLAGWTFVGYEQYSVAQNNGKVQEYVKEIYKLDDITRIEYANGEITTLVNQNGTWHNASFPYLNYDQTLIQNWINLTQTLTTKEIIKNVQNLSLYGIDDQATTITFYDSDHQKQTIKLGHSNKSEDSLYIEGDGDKLYTISYDEYKELLTRPNDFVKCDNLLNLAELHKIKIEMQDEKPIELVKKENWQLNHYFAFDTVLQETAGTQLEEFLKGMKITRYIGTYEDLKPYGLATPKMTLTLNDTTKIEFGNQMGDDIYVCLNDKPDVYVMNVKVFDELKNFKPAKAIEKQVIHIEMDKIEQITLSNPQGTYTLKFMNQVEEDEKTENQVEEDKETVEIEEDIAKAKEAESVKTQNVVAEPIIATVNNIELTNSMASECYHAIQSSLCIEAPLNNPNIEQKQERKSEATFNIILKDQSNLQIELIPYDINYYILRYNDKIEFAVNKDKITNLFNQFTGAIKK